MEGPSVDEYDRFPIWDTVGVDGGFLEGSEVGCVAVALIGEYDGLSEGSELGKGYGAADGTLDGASAG